MARSTDKKLTYEQAMAQLEQLIDDIETGEAGLEQALASYEKGVKLISHCRAILDRVEHRLAELKVDEGGNLAGAASAAGFEDETVIDGEEVDDEPRVDDQD
jgi:exodeoxyribonuclease VII small subunit